MLFTVLFICINPSIGLVGSCLRKNSRLLQRRVATCISFKKIGQSFDAILTTSEIMKCQRCNHQVARWAVSPDCYVERDESEALSFPNR